MITITVRGTPAPQGSKRHVGGGRMIEQVKGVAGWREAVRAETQRVMDSGGGILRLTRQAAWDPGPVAVSVTFTFRRPGGHYGTGRNAGTIKESAPPYPATRSTGDIDKLARAVLDGITQGGAIADDSRVVDLACAKRYADDEALWGAVITIQPPPGEVTRLLPQPGGIT